MMRSYVPLLLLLGGAAPAQHRGDQMSAFQARQAGRLLPVREIERRVIPQVPGAQYLGFDYDAEQLIYVLKFLRDGNVIWIDVDGHDGQILRRRGR